MSNKAAVQVDLTQEIRFAVVMYGGSSLAVYMNGVAQELLKLVRATAPDVNDPSRLHVQDASGSELVYRKLGQMLSQNEPADLSEDSRHPVRTRFVIDVLSGTSAGGINSVFLAKALANDVTLEGLRGVWLDTADFSVLLNDTAGGGTPQKPPAALVNSPFFFQKLLDAFRAMDQERNSTRSPYVDQLDLYTTYTDIQGQTIALKLADIVAMERRHLQNFHFVYSTDDATGEDRNDFTADFTPFLAFAARCTSAHPAAFEPMMLGDIEKSGCDPGESEWEKFYQSYLESMPAAGKGMSREVLASRFKKRPLCDGGVLDNSPFSFAIDQLEFRHSRLPVDRKLVYIEPSPEHPEEVVDANEKPDAIQNALISLSTLPSYQSIRDDIRRVLDRNLLVTRVGRILKGLEQDYDQRRLREGDWNAVSGKEFRDATLDEMIEKMGPSWGGYQRLRVAETTDDLAKVVALASGFNDDSDEFLAIQYLVREWRNRNYAPRPKPGQESENRFLFRFDFKRQIRRLKFVLQKAAAMDYTNRDSFGTGGQSNAADVETWIRAARNSKAGEFSDEFRRQRSAIVGRLNDVLKSIYKRQRLLTTPVGASQKEKHPLSDAIAALGIDLPQLKEILKKDTDAKRLAAAGELLVRKNDAFSVLVKEVEDQFDVIHNSSALIKGSEGDVPVEGILQLENEKSLGITPGQSGFSEHLIKRTLRYYYDHFDSYDMVAYPILYSTGVGEEIDTVEIFRISPEDVQSPAFTSEQRRQKLAGLSLGHFGALLDKRFRLNDMIWGRLDCADRMITALLRSAAGDIPVETLERTRLLLVQQAQEAILLEEIAQLDAEMKAELGFGGDTPGSASLSMSRATREIEKSQLPADVKKYLTTRLLDKNPLQLFAVNYKSLHTMNPEKLLATAGRGSRILGYMLDAIAEKHRVKSTSLAWVTRVMRLFWGFVEISFPNTVPNLLAHHLLKLIYAFELLMIFGGVLLSTSAVEHVGVLALGGTLAIHTVVLILQDLASGRNRWRNVALGVVVGGLALACVLGLLVFIAGLRADSLAEFGQSLYQLITRGKVQ